MPKQMTPLYLITLALTVTQISVANTISKNTQHKIDIQWLKPQRAFAIGETQLSIHASMRCGYYNNQALYASFGLEQQLYQCAKIVIPIKLNHNRFFTNVTFAPLYDSIKHVNDTIIPYDTDKQKHTIDGNNPYNDWYKNLGRQVYYLGEYPLLEAYVGYHLSAQQTIKAGRLIQNVGLADSDTPWGDDGTFSPYAYWLSRDLLSGLRYQYKNAYVSFEADLLSGNNPMKGYANYLNQVQSPNIKGNNTPSYGASLQFNIGHWFAHNNSSHVILSALQNTMNSTWDNDIKDGKRRNSVYAAGLVLSWPIRDNASIDLFSQYTRYLSGLSTNSTQNDPKQPLFLNITQNGFFVGASLHYRAWRIAYTFERFDRFDYNTWAHWLKNKKDFHRTLSELKKLKQYSQIINLQYQFNHYANLALDYEQIDNPLQWISDISNNHPDYRWGLSLNVGF